MPSSTSGRSKAALFDSDANASAPARIRYRRPVWSSLRKAKCASAAASRPTPSSPTMRSMRRQLRSSRKLDRSQTNAASAHPKATAVRIGLVIVMSRGGRGGASGSPNLPRALPHPELQRRRPEPELLADLAFEVAQVRVREVAAREEGERRRIGRALGGIEDLPRRRRVLGLRLLEELVEGPGRDALVVCLDGRL